MTSVFWARRGTAARNAAAARQAFAVRNGVTGPYPRERIARIVSIEPGDQMVCGFYSPGDKLPITKEVAMRMLQMLRFRLRSTGGAVLAAALSSLLAAPEMILAAQ